MSANYSAFPIDKKMAQYLKEESISYPSEMSSRNPYLSDIKSVLSNLEGFNVEVLSETLGSSWQASIDPKQDSKNEAWTILSILELRNGENEFCFEGGWPELCIEITSRLSKLTGPLVLVCDSSGVPLVVTSGVDSKQLAASWE